MAQLSFGVIGVGDMGKRHAENLCLNVSGARLAAIADVSPARTSLVAKELGVEATFDSVEALVARPDIQAVVISSPPKFHAPAIMAAARAGKHIFCEKPLALTLEDADAALDAVARAGVMLQVGHMRRYDPPYVAAKKRIDAGEIGDIVVFKSIGRDQETPASAAPATAINGTIFHDSSSHDFDLGRWLTSDEVVEVHAYSGSLAIPDMKRYEAFDCGVVNLQFSRGAIGNVESFLDAKYGYDIRTEIVGTKGTIQVGSLRRTAVTVLTSTVSTSDNITHWLDRFAEAYRLEMIDFVQTVLAGGKVKVTGLDGRQSLAIADAAVRSQAERRPVAVRAARGVTA
jgi:predicted dehydrogenase